MIPSTLLIEDDCLQAMSHIPDGAVDLVLCDPPYGTTQNTWDEHLPFDRLWEHYRRIVAPRGAVILMGHGAFTARVISSQLSLFRYKLVWVKSKATNFLNAKRQPLRKHEDICVFYVKQPQYRPQMRPGESYNKGVRKNQLTGSYGDFDPVLVKSDGGRYPTDVIYFKTAESEGPVWHPTQKPVELGRYLVRTYTEPGALVLDNCFGSGSFLVAAALEGRDAIGIEKNEDVLEFRREAVDLMDIARSRLDPIARLTTTRRKSDVADALSRFTESRSGTLHSHVLGAPSRR